MQKKINGWWILVACYCRVWGLVVGVGAVLVNGPELRLLELFVYAHPEPGLDVVGLLRWMCVERRNEHRPTVGKKSLRRYRLVLRLDPRLSEWVLWRGEVIVGIWDDRLLVSRRVEVGITPVVMHSFCRHATLGVVGDDFLLRRITVRRNVGVLSGGDSG